MINEGILQKKIKINLDLDLVADILCRIPSKNYTKSLDPRLRQKLRIYPPGSIVNFLVGKSLDTIFFWRASP